MANKDTFKRRSREEIVAWFHEAKQRKHAWEEQMKRDYEEMQIELEKAKADPFYQIGSGDTPAACEPAPIPVPEFKPGNFVAAIRKHRTFQKEWQERINKELDKREAEYLAHKKDFELTFEDI